MSYIVFARKYRPQAFGEVVGQSHITTTLENAIAQDRVAHAYVFAGPRGIGKTTTARILAKVLNCEKGPNEGPCNKCPSCVEITHGTSLDVMEIDGASNRGIDEIRNLRDNIKFAPSKGKYKIYIIDEVHMLTQEAFNALLKTLEEPPAHVKFIFATTSPHKIPATILSRCQRFDFRRISTKDILDSLKRIAKSENLSVKDEVLTLIARHADGSMRDAEVILDQITSFTRGKVDLEDVVKILGIVDEDVLFGLSGAIKEKDAVEALKIIDRVVNDGKDIAQVITGLIEHFRNISVIKVSRDLEGLLDVSSEKIGRYEEEAAKFSVEELLYVIYTLSNTMDFIRKSGMTKVPFETAMIRLTRMGPVISLSEITDRIEKLERSSGPGAGQGPVPKIERPAAVSPRSESTLTRPVIQAKPPVQTPMPKPAADAAENKSQAQAVLRRDGTVDEVIGSWSSISNYIKSKKMSVALYLQNGYPVSLGSGTLTIGFPRSENFHKEALETPEHKQLIENAIREVSGLDIKVKFVVAEGAKAPDLPRDQYLGDDPPADDIPGTDNTARRPEKEVESIIKDALEIFGGEIKDSGKAGSR
jgi:DNA polymerase-3 subunit gamma/tau